MKDKKSDRDRLADLIERIEADPKLHAAINGFAASANLPSLTAAIVVPASAEWDPSISVSKSWIVEMILKLFADRQRVQTSEEDAEALDGWHKDLVGLCGEVDDLSSSTTIPTIQLRGMFLSALEVGFVFGTVAEDRVQVRRAMQARGGKASGKTRSEGRWKVIAKRLAISIAANGEPRSADALAAAVIAAWDVKSPKHPTLRTLAPYMQTLASEPQSTIALKIDGRAKNIRK